MFNIAFIIIVLISGFANAGQMCIEVDTTDKQVVETYVIDAQDWLQKAWDGQVDHRKSVLIRSEIEKSRTERSQIPIDDSDIIQKNFNRPEYKKRAQQEALLKENKGNGP